LQSSVWPLAWRAVAEASWPVEDGFPVVALGVKAADPIIERRADLVRKHARSYHGYEVIQITWRAA
jgi:hypothetical protein